MEMKKKVFSLMLALLLCLPGLAANAATKTSADFTDLKDLDAATKAKFDAMISAGIFDGVSDTTFGLKDEMNRAQFAKVAALIYGLQVDTSLKTSSFSDVKSDDPANGYALPYIEALKNAGITDGTGNGKFSPAGDVTKEQLATFLIKGLGQKEEAESTPGVNDTTVSDWAKGYVALALELKLLSNGADGKFGGTTNATRDLLVVGSFEAKNEFVAQEKKREEEEKKKKEEEEKKNQPVIVIPAPSPAGTPTASVGNEQIVNGSTVEVAAGTTVTFSSSTEGATFYYTTDGSTPTTYRSSTSGTFTVEAASTLKVIAYKAGWANSAVFTVTFELAAPAGPSITDVDTTSFANNESIWVEASVTGTVYYSVVDATLGAPTTPEADQIISGVGSVDYGNVDVTADVQSSFIVDDLADGTYNLYLVVVDAMGTPSAVVTESLTVGDGSSGPGGPVCDINDPDYLECMSGGSGGSGPGGPVCDFTDPDYLECMSGGSGGGSGGGGFPPGGPPEEDEET